MEVLAFNMKPLLTDTERYEIINKWVNNGPLSYSNLVAQTEFYIVKKYIKKDKMKILDKIKYILWKFCYE